VCGLAGGGLASVASIDLSTRDPRIAECEIVVACDVTNPLTGPDGAAAVYGPQKGATAAQVEQLDAALAHLAEVVEPGPGHRLAAALPGAGAAGGLGYGLVMFAGAQLARGIDLVLDAVDFDRRCRQADLVITGEGRLDGQSIQGKTCIGVAQRAAGLATPTIALAGTVGPDAAVCLDHGLSAYHTIASDVVDADRAMAEAALLLEQLACDVMRQA
jgi:glycerate kinase